MAITTSSAEMPEAEKPVVRRGRPPNAEKPSHGDRAPPAAPGPRVVFNPPVPEEEDNDMDQAIQNTFDPRNPVYTATWTDEEGAMTPAERRQLRREASMQGVRVPGPAPRR